MGCLQLGSRLRLGLIAAEALAIAHPNEAWIITAVLQQSACDCRCNLQLINTGGLTLVEKELSAPTEWHRPLSVRDSECNACLVVSTTNQTQQGLQGQGDASLSGRNWTGTSAEQRRPWQAICASGALNSRIAGSVRSGRSGPTASSIRLFHQIPRSARSRDKHVNDLSSPRVGWLGSLLLGTLAGRVIRTARRRSRYEFQADAVQVDRFVLRARFESRYLSSPLCLNSLLPSGFL